jgi:hypothetical protein
MPYNVSFKEEGSQLWVVFEGELSFTDMRLSWEKRIEDPERFKTVQYVIIDWSKADMQQLKKEMVEIASEWVREAVQMNPDVTFIGITGNQLNYGMARMLFGVTGEIPWKTFLTQSYEEFENLPFLKRHAE